MLELDETRYEWGTLHELECETVSVVALCERRTLQMRGPTNDGQHARMVSCMLEATDLWRKARDRQRRHHCWGAGVTGGWCSDDG